MTARLVMAREVATGQDREIPLPEVIAHRDRWLILFWDEDAGEFTGLTLRQAFGWLMSRAETFTPGSWAAWAAYELACEFGGDDYLRWRAGTGGGRPG